MGEALTSANTTSPTANMSSTNRTICRARYFVIPTYVPNLEIFPGSPSTSKLKTNPLEPQKRGKPYGKPRQ